MTEERLRAELRNAAEAYVPDRAVIASRTAAGRTAARRRDRMRPILAAAAVLGVAVASVVGVQLSNEPDPPPVVAIAPPETVPPTEPAKSPSAKPSSAVAKPPSKPATAKPSFLECAGTVDKNSVATWTQNTVTVHNKKAAEDVEVTITVPRVGDSRSAGRFSTVPNTDLDVSVKETAQSLVYTFTLKDGAKLKPGTWVFAAQFEHRSGRDKTDDSYLVEATSARSEGSWTGDFSRT